MTTATDITCTDYSPDADGNPRCRHFELGGSCTHDDHLMCIEWLLVNEPRPTAKGLTEEPEPEGTSQDKDGTPTTGRLQHSLFGPPVEIRPARTKSKPRKAKATDPARRSHTFQPKPRPQEPPLVRNITDDEIASFREQGNEVCVQTEVSGPVWVVPEYSETKDRLEMRVDHAATLAAVCSAFPGARVVEVKAARGTAGENGNAEGN
jgi:hypothetical protein